MHFAFIGNSPLLPLVPLVSLVPSNSKKFSVFRFNPATPAFPPSHLSIACKHPLLSVWRRFRFLTPSGTRKTKVFRFPLSVFRLFCFCRRSNPSLLYFCLVAFLANRFTKSCPPPQKNRPATYFGVCAERFIEDRCRNHQSERFSTNLL